MRALILLAFTAGLTGCATGLTAGCDRMCQRAGQNTTVQARWHTDPRPVLVQPRPGLYPGQWEVRP